MRCLRWQTPNINYILANSNVCFGNFSFQRLTQNEDLIRIVAFNYLETKWSESYQNNFVAANMIVVIILFFFISPHTHQKAPGIQFFSAPPQEPARKRNHLCPDTHTDPSPVNTNTHINKEVSSLAVYQLLRLTFSRNLPLCAAVSGYCRRA